MYETYNQNKTLYNIHIKHILKFSIFATFQQPYPSTNDLFIIMGIPVTIELLSSLRRSFQLHAIKNRIKTTTVKLRE